MNPHPGTILIVDDEPHVVYVVKFKLEKAGLITVERWRGRSALITVADAGATQSRPGS